MMTNPSIVRAAVVQAASVAFDPDRTLEKTGDLAADVARRGARLAVFPEAFVSGYPRGSDFGAVGRYARPDVFRLEVNERANPVVAGIAPPVTIEADEPLALNEPRQPWPTR